MVATLAVKSATVKPRGAAVRARAAWRAARILGLFRSMPPVRVAPSWDGSGSWSRMPSGRKLMSAQSRAVVNRPAMPASRVMISPKWARSRRQRSSLVLCTVASKAQDVFAFGAGLQLQQPEADPKPAHALLRFLAHDSLRRLSRRHALLP